MNDNAITDPRVYAIPDIHGHAKGEHKAFIDERPIPLSARMLFLWFYHACRRGWPRFLMVTDHMNYLTFEDPAAINLVRRALKLAQAGDLYGAAETASVEVGHAAVVSDGLRRGMRYSIGAEVDNDPRSRPDAQNIVDAMKPDGMIRSVHFLTIDHPTHGPNWNWPFDNPEFRDVFDLVGTQRTWELYMETLLDAIERLPGNIVGHPYVPAVFGHWPDDETLERYEDRLVDACEARGMAIELNTRFLYRDHAAEEKAKYLAAYRRLLRKCKAKNVGVAVGSDAHSPKDQGGAFETVLALLDECEINELVFPLAGRLARVALRVERKAEPSVEATVVAADDRKARKARPSEPAPLEAIAAEIVEPVEAGETAAPHADAEAPKPKARPKRSKAKAVEAMEPPVSGGSTLIAMEEPPAAAAEAAVEVPVESEPVAEAKPSAPETVIADGTSEAASEKRAPEAEASPERAAPQDGAAGQPAAAEIEAELPAAVATESTTAHNGSVDEQFGDREAHGLGVSSGAMETSVLPETAGAQADAEPEAVAAPEAEIAVEPDEPATAEDAAASGAGEPHDVAAQSIGADATIERLEHEAAEAIVAVDAVAAAIEAEGEAAVIEEVLEAVEAPPRVHRPRPKPAAAPKAKTAAAARAGKSTAAKAKPAAKKAAKPAAKSGAKKAPAKKAPAKKAAPVRASAKKSTAKKTAAKKSPAKKTAVRASSVKKSAVKKSAAKKAGAKKTARRR